MKKYLAFLSLMTICGLLLLWTLGGGLSAAVNTEIGGLPPGLEGKGVIIEGVHGWFIPAINSKQCVLLLHGVRSNRTSMVSRAQFLKQEGYSSFLIDLQAHGETIGESITFGYEESKSAHTALRYMRETENCENIASLGQSLGGAASLLGEKPLDVDAFIIESVYSRIETAVFNRLEMRVGVLAHVLAPLIYQQIPIRLGISLNDLQPIEVISNINAPILIVAGSEDKHTTLSESQSMFEKAFNPKEILVLKGAEHVDFYRYSPDQYRETVIGFLAKYLKNGN